MEQKRFTKNDASFLCQNCHAEVQPLGYSSRNHCPFCLCSLHVDILPGDRANPCGGIMDAISAIPDKSKGFILLHQCRKCGEITKNRSAHEATCQPDDHRRLIELTSHPAPDLKRKGRNR